MNARWLVRGAVAGSLAIVVFVAWQVVRRPVWVGDVPYVASRPRVVDEMLNLASVDAGDFLFDLGSGDGRIPIRAAVRFGARGRGFELDPALVEESRRSARSAGVAGLVEFVEGDLFEADLRPATAVTLYLLPTVNLALRPRLLAQLQPGTPVVSQSFDMAEWRPDEKTIVPLSPPAELYMWVVPGHFGGVWDILTIATGATSSAGSTGRPATEEPGSMTLRLVQRFQDVEGELLHGAGRASVVGRVRGSTVELVTVNAALGTGPVELVGSIADDRLLGEMRAVEDGSPRPAGITGSFTAVRRPATLSGAWEIGSLDEPFEPLWTLYLSRSGGRWSATRTVGRSSLANGTAALTPGTAGSDGNEPVDDLYVWGSSIAFGIDAGESTARRVMYYGLIEGDHISGFTQDGGDLVAWIGRRRRSAP